LVVPKRHVEGVRELDAEESASLMRTVGFVSEKLDGYLHPAGFNYGFNEGSIAGQTVFHLHFHIMPRYVGDGVEVSHIFHRKPEDKIFMTDEEMRPLAEEFRAIF
ncbi:MAG: HIT family protein, partial [Candidatus Moranbacteria bacterium]|nr:HIT family protein [Candidatus Moranbacteria bacterium]